MEPRSIFGNWLIEYLFSRFRWYRRSCGGHWELWYIDVVHSYIWHNLTGCTQTGIGKHYGWRVPCGFGTPTCEDYRKCSTPIT